MGQAFTYDHTHWRTRDPVRSPIDKSVRARLVVGSVTTSESLVLYVFFAPYLLSPSLSISVSIVFFFPPPHYRFFIILLLDVPKCFFGFITCALTSSSRNLPDAARKSSR